MDDIVTGDSLGDQIGNLHEEDVVLRFTGTRPDQLITGSYYEGTVDGYADFGIFVDIGERVTGLLHRSELPRRLESLDWEPGDTVFVQVKNVRDNGNVDLGWSIRTRLREFRGAFIHDPTGDYEPDESDATADSSAGGRGSGGSGRGSGGSGRGSNDSGSGGSSPSGSESDTGATAGSDEPSTPTVRAGSTDDAAERGRGSQDSDAGGSERDAAGSDRDAGARATTESAEAKAVTDAGSDQQTVEAEAVPAADLERVEVGSLSDRVGDVVRLEGVITSVRQTSGPTVFEIQDETGTVDCAAFVEAGVRAYPDAEAGDLVQLDGEIRERRGELQVETERLRVLEDEAAARVDERMEGALEAEASAPEVDPLAADPAVEATLEEVRDVATAIRRAVLESRPVIVRHDASVDGYLAGAAIERAVLPLVEVEHTAADAGYHYFDRRPLEGVYTMDDATKDVTNMLGAAERFGEKTPLFVFAATGTTRDSLDGFDLLRIYDAEAIVVDGGDADGAITDAVRAVVNPSLAGADADTSATALATAIAVHVDDAVREDLAHLPAVSFWEDTPESYVELAADADYYADDVERLREAIALEAYYQSYEDKRELVADLLFDRGDGLVEQVSEQFREKLALEVETAEANLESRAAGGIAFAVLDTDAYTHRYDFPPKGLLLDEVHRRNRDGPFVTVGVDTDELHVRSTESLDVRAVADRVASEVDDAGVAARGGHDRIEFVAGRRDAVVDATVEAIGDLL